jgi:hypothetical protein
LALIAVPSAASAQDLALVSCAGAQAGTPCTITANADNTYSMDERLDVFARGSAAPCAATESAEAAAGGAHVISATEPAGSRYTDYKGSFTPAAAGSYTICGYENFAGQDSGGPSSLSLTVNSPGAGGGGGGGGGGSGGQPKVHCVVPKLIGKTLSAAKKALKAAHCSVGKVAYKHDKRSAIGHVISQGIPAGRTRNAGTSVSLVAGK